MPMRRVALLLTTAGLALTASNLIMEGRFYVFLNTVHALTVTLGLMYIPFGKLFHIFQRPANLGVAYYKRAGAAGEQQRCARCDEPFPSGVRVCDLTTPDGYERHPWVELDLHLHGLESKAVVSAPKEEVARAYEAARGLSDLPPAASPQSEAPEDAAEGEGEDRPPAGEP